MGELIAFPLAAAFGSLPAALDWYAQPGVRPPSDVRPPFGATGEGAADLFLATAFKAVVAEPTRTARIAKLLEWQQRLDRSARLERPTAPDKANADAIAWFEQLLEWLAATMGAWAQMLVDDAAERAVR